ncbi:MAG TPA: tetratricopeptide repeat protein, partial [Spirochaetota bacterium]|nr:tetratricopeptide repeat protein [Spirochaetota bacterium]
KYDRALELDKKNLDTMNNLAVVCASAGRFKRAEKLLQRVIELQNDNAIRKYDRALELDKKNLDTMNNLAVVCASAGRFKRAEKLLQRVIELQNDNATAHRNLGILYDTHLENPRRAITHYKRYLAIVPGASDRNLVELWISRVEGANK